MVIITANDRARASAVVDIMQGFKGLSARGQQAIINRIRDELHEPKIADLLQEYASEKK